MVGSIKRAPWDGVLWIVQEGRYKYSLRDNTGVVVETSDDSGWVFSMGTCQGWFVNLPFNVGVETGNWVDGTWCSEDKRVVKGDEYGCS